MRGKIGVGIIGCGVISDIYLKNLTKRFKNVEVLACSDLMVEKAETMASKYGIAKVGTVGELLEDSNIQIVLNLTIPQAHAEVTIAALQAGKNVYEEKPLAVSCEQGKAILDLAHEKQLLVACAPDTFLGAGMQTVRKIIDDGWVGDIVGATAFMGSAGPESWHPSPGFLYQKGAGPLFDIGPYYITALVSLFGPVEAVSAFTKKTYEERTITSMPLYGKKIVVEEPTHITALLHFVKGATVQLTVSFDIVGTSLPYIEIYGTNGTLVIPDPNTYGGTIKILAKQTREWRELPLLFGYQEDSRGLAVSDLADSIKKGRTPRASAEMAYHVLETMYGIKDSGVNGATYRLGSSCDQPKPLSLGMLEGIIED